MSTTQLGEKLGSILSKTQWKLRNYFQKKLTEASLEITVEQWSILAAINSSQITQSEIANRIEKDKTNVTRMADLLEKKGFVERRTILKDRRGYHIYITKKGKRIINKIIPIATEVNRIGMTGFSREEQKFLIETLKKVWQNYDLG